ncbi:MAG: hypothetical protein OXJ53_14965 [Gammaproteobacteria bacterium]|nr:hypothetical protein [Gammaproteobacteria bacterium]MDE0270033.1 hypothetical protein [Gammaproteobacteria bacterium]
MRTITVGMPDVLREKAVSVNISALPIADRIPDPEGSPFLVFFRYQMTHRRALLLGTLNPAILSLSRTRQTTPPTLGLVLLTSDIDR